MSLWTLTEVFCSIEDHRVDRLSYHFYRVEGNEKITPPSLFGTVRFGSIFDRNDYSKVGRSPRFQVSDGRSAYNVVDEASKMERETMLPG